MRIKTESADETKKVAKLLAGDILKSHLKTVKGLVLAFSGDLGSGKTTFIQGFLKGLGVKNKVTSPTFVIMKHYSARGDISSKARYKRAYHIDCYRLRKPAELNNLGFKELLNKPKSIFLIEWAEKIKRILPKDTVWLEFRHGKKENEREITIR